MAKMIIRIADANTRVRNSSNSVAGHMWFEVQSMDNPAYNFSSGFASKSGVPRGAGHRVTTDAKNYEEAYYTAVINISESDAKKLYAFHTDPNKHGFSTKTYNAVTHSCVDYVYKALNVIGKNPNYDKGLDGDIIPANNVDNLQKLLGKQIASQSYNVHLNTLPNLHSVEMSGAFYANQADLMKQAMTVWGAGDVAMADLSVHSIPQNVPQLASVAV